jgi:hypothetical protein
MRSSKPISMIFNIILFFYLFLDGIVQYLFESGGDREVPWDKVYEWSPSFAVFGSILIVLSLALIGAFIVKRFWNSFISDTVKLREINYNESLAIVLLIAIVST